MQSNGREAVQPARRNLDDCRRYAAAAAAKGGKVQLDIYKGLHHLFQRSTEELPSARNALDAAARFLSDHWK